jgi:hypothetical protein
MPVMDVHEVPSWRWGQRFDPRLVHTVLDAADATNDLALGLAEAHHLEVRASARLDQLNRQTVEAVTPWRRAAADGLYGAAAEFGEQVAKVYARQAWRFACLTARLLTAVQAGTDPGDLAADEVGDLLPSQLYRDPGVLPAPPVADDEDTILVEGLSLALAYADVMKAVTIVRASGEGASWLDPGTVDDPSAIAWSMGGVDLARGLHLYGNLCLWHLAGEQPAVHDH